jgi:4-aminobutyrate aminotransferase/(S)-3-amino-2-methylpropionate transaminase
MDAPQVGGLGGTYGGNPLACVAALAAIETYEQEDLAARARQIGEILFEKLGALRDADPRVAEVRGRGAMVAIELVDPPKNGEAGPGEPDAALTAKVAAAAHAAGVVLLTCGTYGNVIRFLPPLSIPDHLLIEGLDVVAEAVAGA